MIASTLLDLATERERLAEEQAQLAGRIALLVRRVHRGDVAEMAAAVELLVTRHAEGRRREAELDWRISAGMAEEKRVRGR